MIAPWEKLGEEPCRVGYRRLIRRRYRLPGGRESVFDIKDEGKVVAILALTPENNEVVLARQFRPGPEAVLLELPGGQVDTGESPEEAARRELLEETGYSGELQLAAACFSCAYSNRVKHAFVATGCRKLAEPSPADKDFIEVVLMPLPEFRQHLRSGQLTDVEIGFLALDFLGLL